MDKSPLVSIVVPVHNVVGYLDACLASIAAQTYENIEVVLVDDGSTDGSGKVCQRWVESDARFHLIGKKNGGLSDARNVGVANASGEYVSFVDSDDVVSCRFVETMLAASLRTGCDLVAMAKGLSFSEESSLASIDDVDVDDVVDTSTCMDSKRFIEEMLYQAYETGAPFKMCKAEIAEKCPFPVGLLYEDAATTYKFAVEANGVCVVDCCKLYAYRARAGSIMRGAYSAKKAESALFVSDQMYRDISRAYPDLQAAASSRCFSICRQVFSQTPREEKRDRDALWAVMVERRRCVMHDRKARKRERLAVAVSFLGQPAFSAFCALYRRLGFSA